MNRSFLLAWASFRGMFPFQPAEDALLHVFMGTPQEGQGIQGWSHQQELMSPAGSPCCPKEHPMGWEYLLWFVGTLADLSLYQHQVKPGESPFHSPSRRQGSASAPRHKIT